jgi:ATP-dependent RNA helicase DDX21
MHGDIAQNQREVTMQRFREGKFQVLVATDVASRGLDIPEVELVIQLDPPRDTESYIHRSGRTARAGRAGTCLTFYNDRSAAEIDKIEEVAGITLDRVGIPSDEDMIKANTKGILKKLLDVEPEVLPMFEDTAELLINQHHGDASKALQIALAFCSGHYKMANPDESLLTGRHQMVTIKMTSTEEGGHLGAQACYAILYKYWAPRISDDVTVMRPFADGTGAVFDIRSQWVDGFLDNYSHLSSGGRTPNFEVSRAKSLPDCGSDEAKKDREPKPEGDGGDEDQGGDDMGGGGGRPPMACFNCGEAGHKSMDCSEPKKERGGGGDRGPMACFNCGEEGHKSMDCPEPRKERGGGDRGPMKCYNCQEEGHGARDCPEPKKPLTCYKCQEEGHMARDCPDA